MLNRKIQRFYEHPLDHSARLVISDMVTSQMHLWNISRSVSETSQQVLFENLWDAL